MHQGSPCWQVVCFLPLKVKQMNKQKRFGQRVRCILELGIKQPAVLERRLLFVSKCVCVCVCVFAGGLCCLDGGLDFSIGIVVQAGLRTIACAWFLSAAIAV